MTRVVVALAIALLTASRNTRVYATVDGRQIDCGTWNEQTVEPGCFGRFGKFELAQIVFPLVAAFAACIVGLRLLQLLQPQGAFAVGEVVSLRRLHPFDAKRFAATFDARAVTANHMAAGDAQGRRTVTSVPVPGSDRTETLPLRREVWGVVPIVASSSYVVRARGRS